MKRRKIEESHQIALIKWASYRPDISPYLIHIPNGGSRNAIEAGNLKRSGVRAGVPDLFLAKPSKGFHGLWIELKSPKTNSTRPIVTEKQKEYLVLLNEVGYFACVCYGWHEAREVIISYLDIK